jgi:YjbE family integral membrane protein
MLNGVLLEQLSALAQVLIIDLTLAGDNAIVVGLAVAGLPAEQKRRAILVGIAGATILRIVLGAVTVQLLAIVGLLLAGGLLLLWVCWKMFRELQAQRHARHAVAASKTLPQAMLQIIVADLSMSLDNVLAVAGVAKDHLWVLVVGLSVSVMLMGLAANLVANVLERHRWVAGVGLLIVLYVAGTMVWDGAEEVLPYVRRTLRLT